VYSVYSVCLVCSVYFVYSVCSVYLVCLAYSLYSACSVWTVLMRRSKGPRAKGTILPKKGLTEIG
jgi:hypothetical protein